jgi:SRSO17 transposase
VNDEGFSFDCLEMTAERLGEFLSDFSDCFEGVHRKTLRSIRYYTTGLLSQTVRKNIERIAEQDESVNYQNIHHGVSDSDWAHELVIEKVAQRANATFSQSSDNALLIDEAGFTKKGKQSVGVSRQWNGRLGKVDNCQVGVFGVLSSKASACPVNVKLFLPESWTSDPERCRKAGVPEDHIKPQSKIDLAKTIIEEAVAQRIDFKWIGFDSFYGRDKSFLAWIDDLNREFVGDIPSNTKVRLPGSADEITVEELAGKRSFRIKSLRPQCKGELQVEAMSVTVEVKISKTEFRTWRLIVTRDLDGGDTKYSLTNNFSDSLERLAYKQRQRFWVERSFEDAKTSCGMAQYQVRKWQGWHHHMSLVMLAMLFLFEERVQNHNDLPLLSCQDIVTVIDHCLFKSKQTLADRIGAIEERHFQRYDDIARRQSKHRSNCQQV